MIALIQRVSQAKVEVDQRIIGQIQQGLLVLLGVEKEDNRQKADKLVEKVLNYRVFSDENGKMNLNVQQIQGEVLVVSQFTLAADTQKACAQVFPKVPRPILPMNYIPILFKSAVKKSAFLAANLLPICRSV